MSHLSPPSPKPTSPYARPSTPIPPNSPESPLRSLAFTKIHAPSRDLSLSSNASSSHSCPTSVLPSTRSRMPLGDSCMGGGKDEDEKGGREREGEEGDQARPEQSKGGEEAGFDTLKSDFEFFFRRGGGEGEKLGGGSEGRARGRGGRRVDGSLYEGPRTRNDEEEEEDISPSTTLWDSPDLGTGKGKGKVVEERGRSPQRGLVYISPFSPANEGLGFDFEIKLDAASSSPVKGDTTITSSSIYSLPVPQQRPLTFSTTERPISAYSSTSGLDGDVSGSASNSGGEESEEEEEEEGRYEVSSSSPVKSIVVRRALVQIEGDVADAIGSSSASDGETVSGDSAQSGDDQRRANRLRKMQKEDCRGKAYPYTSTRPDYRADYLDLGSSTGDGGAQGDEEDDDDSSVFQVAGASGEDTESDIADVSLDGLSALHLGEVTTV